MELSNARRYTNKLITQAEEGVTSWETIAKACLSYMSEADVEDMATSEELVWEDEEEDEEEEEEEDEEENEDDTEDEDEE